MPLKLARPDRPLILVDGYVNAQKAYQFILDTGPSLTAVSPRLSQEMKIEGMGRDSLVGAGSVEQSAVGTMTTLALGDVVLENINVAVSDVFSSLSQATGVEIDGILCYNILRKFSIVTDYHNSLLSLKASRTSDNRSSTNIMRY